MARIQIGGAGGAPSNNVTRSLRESHRGDYLIGTSATPSDLFLTDADEKHVVPHGAASEYEPAIIRLLTDRRPDFLHVQNDFEVRAVSRLRDKIHALGVKTYLPSPATVENCVDNHRSYKLWRRSGLRVPETVLLRSRQDLQAAFEQFGPALWLRAVTGTAGHGALPADDMQFATMWIDHYDGWGHFTAAKRLGHKTVTWLSLWFEGDLVVAQSRRRRGWSFGSRTLSGVTGITSVSETCRDQLVDAVALEAVLAVDPRPHGIFGVDMTYDDDEYPNPTEINIGRFFTTVYFFTRAGLNLPAMYCDIGIDNEFPSLERTVNPLPEGLLWIRGMDVEPALVTTAELEALERTAC